MFDNPKKELQQLEDRLLAAEDEQWEQSEDSEDPDAALEDVKRILERSDWEETQEREPLYRSFLSQEEGPEEPEAPRPPQKLSRVPVLLAALLVETALLLGVIAWWLLWK